MNRDTSAQEVYERRDYKFASELMGKTYTLEFSIYRDLLSRMKNLNSLVSEGKINEENFRLIRKKLNLGVRFYRTALKIIILDDEKIDLAEKADNAHNQRDVESARMLENFVERSKAWYEERSRLQRSYDFYVSLIKKYVHTQSENSGREEK